MFYTIKRYQTADRKEHKTQKIAEEHIADQCRKIIESKMGPLSGSESHKDRVRLILNLIPDAKSARLLALELLKNFTTIDEDDEDDYEDDE